MNTEGKETPPENGHCSFKITLRSQNATVMRTNFHGLAIDNALVRLDFDKFLCSVCFDTKLQHNRKSCFHTWINLGIIAVLLGFVKQALDLKVRPSALGSYSKEKGIQFGAEHLIRFSTKLSLSLNHGAKVRIFPFLPNFCDESSGNLCSVSLQIL